MKYEEFLLPSLPMLPKAISTHFTQKKSIETLKLVLTRAIEDRELTQDRYLSGIDSGIIFDESNSLENQAKAALPIL